jgi:hypothetical protein
MARAAREQQVLQHLDQIGRAHLVGEIVNWYPALFANCRVADRRGRCQALAQ